MEFMYMFLIVFGVIAMCIQCLAFGYSFGKNTPKWIIIPNIAVFIFNFLMMLHNISVLRDFQ